MLNSLHGQIPRLRTTSAERAFSEHKKCFKACLKVFETNSLSQDEKSCIIGCLSKYQQSQRYISQKIHKLMTEHAAQNQQVSALYDRNRDESKS